MDNDKYYMDNEIWKVYKITESRYCKRKIYEVSSLGRVKINGELFTSFNPNFRYRHIGGFFVHRAVAELFIPNPENKPYVDHINTNKFDNRTCNLRWVTKKENNNNPLTREHLSKSNAGRKVSDEARQKMSESHKGKQSGNKGKKHSEESKQKISASIKKYWKKKKGGN